METQKIRWPFTKVSSGNVCSLSCRFFIDLQVFFALAKKKLLYKYIDLIVNVLEKNSETSSSFFGREEGQLCTSICYKGGKFKQTWMAVDGKKGSGQNFRLFC